MLIIAIPKSAGTSLSMTLAKLHNLEFDEGLTHYNQIKNGNIIELRHGSMGNVKKGDIKKFKNEKIIYHEHLFPTKDNIKNLKNQKKVILLREPEEILHSWWRAEQSGIHSKHPMLKNCKTEKGYVEKAKKLGALKIFKDFKQGWEKAKTKDDLIIYYKDLMKNPQQIINDVEKHFDLLQSENIKLLKIRYNRGNKLRKFFKKIYAKLSKINFLLKIKRKLFPNLTFG